MVVCNLVSEFCFFELFYVIMLQFCESATMVYEYFLADVFSDLLCRLNHGKLVNITKTKQNLELELNRTEDVTIKL